MKIVLYTQRVEVVESYGERRDCADQCIPVFLEKCGFLPIPLPNVLSVAEEMMYQLKPAGLVLTGGNSLVRYGGQAPERDETEKKLLDIALKGNVPVFGFCRGMQVILDYYDCRLEEISGHVAVRHKVQGSLGEFTVNSYHNQACFQVKRPLEVLAISEDGVIEAVTDREKGILAVMWHPERESEFCMEDIRRLQDLFEKERK
ncbi:gamma-glutamyl-gamma-aminobutyrate hydrolase family protein [Lachnospiraceae bacterium KK002]|uniref:gamma-glutamyl-gamma-aminobutyrate hydrolase family protein n=1 Tax=Eubacterium sp. 14-2 TaxID=1235790 RepID=UPI000335B39D|nr:gamma-glutamyl-gamma-aminobutyrate hydrolase family protein [Eubacterium sp. 14-2]EOT23592.1 hypothetical protein C805_03257 [Eubacterium sp. 14-2]